MKKKINQSVPSIFDLENDDDGILRMPFNPADYGEDNGILRECHECKNKFPQETMKELGLKGGWGSGTDKIYEESMFFCKECWFKSEYSDASNWRA